MIRVGRKHERNAVYIGRGSPLGNPFVMKDQSQAERDRVCDAYAVWLVSKIEDGDARVLGALEHIKVLSKQGDVVLGCFCAPKRCHGDFIKEICDE
jgi:hypothetical protein